MCGHVPLYVHKPLGGDEDIFACASVAFQPITMMHLLSLVKGIFRRGTICYHMLHYALLQIVYMAVAMYAPSLALEVGKLFIMPFAVSNLPAPSKDCANVSQSLVLHMKRGHIMPESTQ